MPRILRPALCAGAFLFANAVAAQTPPAAGPAGPAPSTMSESKFLGALYSEIERNTPQENALGDGEVTASFHVNAAGKIDRVKIDRTTSPSHAEAVKKILSAVAAPPPPGGSMDVGQTFKFHGNEPEPAEAPTTAAPAAGASATPTPTPPPATPPRATVPPATQTGSQPK
jgi:hypothetical protein